MWSAGRQQEAAPLCLAHRIIPATRTDICTSAARPSSGKTRKKSTKGHQVRSRSVRMGPWPHPAGHNEPQRDSASVHDEPPPMFPEYHLTPKMSGAPQHYYWQFINGATARTKARSHFSGRIHLAAPPRTKIPKRITSPNHHNISGGLNTQSNIDAEMPATAPMPISNRNQPLICELLPLFTHDVASIPEVIAGQPHEWQVSRPGVLVLAQAVQIQG